MHTYPNSAAAVIESLEPRLAPAGTVVLTTAGGVLTITGDSLSNGITITDVPGMGVWTISDPLGSTTFVVNNVFRTGPFDIVAQNSIKASLGDGNDQLDLIPSSAPSGTVLSGALSISMGKGNDTVHLGDSSGQQLIVNGPTTIDLGEGMDTLQTGASAVFAGTVSILAGAGNDSVYFTGNGDHTFHKGLSVDMGGGSDLFSMLSHRLDVLGGAVSIKGAGQLGAGQTVNFSPAIAMIDGAFNVAIGAGLVTMNMGTLSTDTFHFGAGVSISTGTGNDTLSLNGTITVAGAMSVDLKDGINLITHVANRTLQAASLSIKGGLGADTVLLDNNSTLTVTGALSFNLGDGVNTIQIDPGEALTAGSLTVAGTNGADTFNFTGASLTVLGSVTLGLGAGANATTFSPTVAALIGGSLNLTGGAGVDNFTVTGPSFRVLGGLTESLGDGLNTTSFESTLFHVAGNLTYNGGKNDDSLRCISNSMLVGKAVLFTGGEATTSNDLYLRPVEGTLGSVVFKGGNSADGFALGHMDGVTTTRLGVTGTVNATMGAGTAAVIFTDTVIHGAVTVGITSTAAQTDAVTINESTIDGAVLINQGAGVSTLEVADSFIRGAFTANLGAGADEVKLDATAGTSLSTWFGIVTVNLGAGDDVITIGSSLNVLNVGNSFYKNVNIDGGAGTDSLAHGGNTYYASSTLTPANFP